MFVLPVEYRPAGHADESHIDALGLELAGCLQGNRNFTATADDGQVFVGNLIDHISTPSCALDGRALEVWQVLPGQREDRWGLRALESNVIGCGCFVAVCGTPEVEVGDRTQVDGGFDRLMSGTVFAKTDGIVRGFTIDKR